MTQYDSELDLVNERLKQIDELKEKFSGFPEVQEKLQSARAVSYTHLTLPTNREV